jgi:hypothetical protein
VHVAKVEGVEEDEEMEREDERGVANVPERAELALDKREWRKLLQRITL